MNAANPQLAGLVKGGAKPVPVDRSGGNLPTGRCNIYRGRLTHNPT